MEATPKEIPVGTRCECLAPHCFDINWHDTVGCERDAAGEVALTRELMQSMRETAAIARYQPGSVPFGKSILRAYAYEAVQDGLRALDSECLGDAKEHLEFAAAMIQAEEGIPR